MFPRMERGPTNTVPEPANSGRIFGAPLIGPPYMPGGCGTLLTFREAMTSGGPVKSSLIIEPLTRMRPTVSAMQSLARNLSTPLPTFASEPLPEITPEKEVLMFLVPTVKLFAPKKTFPGPPIEPIVTPDWWPLMSREPSRRTLTRAVPPVEAPLKRIVPTPPYSPPAARVALSAVDEPLKMVLQPSSLVIVALAAVETSLKVVWPAVLLMMVAWSAVDGSLKII